MNDVSNYSATLLLGNIHKRSQTIEHCEVVREKIRKGTPLNSYETQTAIDMLWIAQKFLEGAS